MKRRMFALACAAALALSGCAWHASRAQEKPEGAYSLYFSTAADRRATAAVDCEYFTVPAGASVVPSLVGALLDGPEETRLSSPFPAGVRLLSWKSEEGRLQLNLSEQYGGLSGVDLTVADYCIALTLCQVPGVESVYVTVEGKEIPYRRTQQLTAADVLLSGAEEEPVYVDAELWYPRAGWDGLGVEYRQVLKTEDTTTVEAVLAAWLEGPQHESLSACMPQGAEVYSATLEDGICYVNFSSAFRENAPQTRGQSRLVLYALVNTLGGIDAVEAVQLQIEGESVQFFGGMRADRPLEPNLTLKK